MHDLLYATLCNSLAIKRRDASVRGVVLRRAAYFARRMTLMGTAAPCVACVTSRCATRGKLGARARTSRPMLKIDLVFLMLAAACLLCGVTMGVYMGMAHDFALAPVHAHLNLVGWASLALFGLTYRAYPALQQGASARASCVVRPKRAALSSRHLFRNFSPTDSTGARDGASVVLGAVLFFAWLLMLAFKHEPQTAPAMA